MGAIALNGGAWGGGGDCWKLKHRIGGEKSTFSSTSHLLSRVPRLGVQLVVVVGADDVEGAGVAERAPLRVHHNLDEDRNMLEHVDCEYSLDVTSFESGGGFPSYSPTLFMSST